MKILIVEDYESIAASLVRGLAHAGYETAAVTDGEMALARVKMWKPDMLVLDVGLPKKDGLTLARELRHAGYMMPILFLTARDTLTDKIAGFDAGGDDYLVKPFDFDELLARVRALVRRVRPSSGMLKCDNLVIDLTAHITTRAKKEIDLAPREFDLLVYLMKNTGQAISRTELLDEVWGSSETLSTDTVDVHISYLRRKIDRDADTKLIQTVKGIGYKIVAC